MKNNFDAFPGLIFSFNRAMQLDAVLKSFFYHCQDTELIELSVLYKVSDELNRAQYESLIRDYPQVSFIAQTDFRNDVLNWITQRSSEALNKFVRKYLHWFQLSRKSKVFKVFFNRSIRAIVLWFLPCDSDKLILFLVDDNIFTRDFSLESIIQQMRECPKALGFSLRLGRNTTYCYAHSSDQALPHFTEITDHVLRYDWTAAEHDFAYPLEVSSSVFRVKQILPLLLRSDFGNPNGLEGVIASQPYRYARTNPFLFCFETSITFCAPINIVQNVVNNRVGNQSLYSAASLCQIFESGERINIRVFDDFVSNSCHQEVELYFTKKVK